MEKILTREQVAVARLLSSQFRPKVTKVGNCKEQVVQNTESGRSARRRGKSRAPSISRTA